MKYIYASLIILCSGIVFMSSQTSASFFSTRSYCIIQDDSIQISLQKKDKFLCTAYLQAINKVMQRTASDLLIVQGYINLGQDIGYRLEIRDVLREKFLHMDRINKNIIYTTQLFEYNIFTKTKGFLVKELGSYHEKLIKEVEKRQGKPPEYNGLVTDQITLIEDIRDAEDFDTLLPLAQKYLYLKKILTGKLGS